MTISPKASGTMKSSGQSRIRSARARRDIAVPGEPRHIPEQEQEDRQLDQEHEQRTPGPARRPQCVADDLEPRERALAIGERQRPEDQQRENRPLDDGG